MATEAYHLCQILLLVISVSVHYTVQLQYTQSEAFLRIHQLLHYPPSLSTIYRTSNLCDIDPTPYFTLACYGDDLTQLQLNGQNGTFPLPQNFSTSNFFSAITEFSSLRVLSLVSLGLEGPLPRVVGNLSSLEILNLSFNALHGEIPDEISYLNSLQTLILDHNRFEGQVPSWLSSLPVLAVLSLNNNSLTGSLPNTFSDMQTLRALALSGNNLSGEFPDVHSLTNLQVLNLEDNHFGPHFPRLANRLVSLNLRKNKFSLDLPDQLRSFYQLQRFDVSSNAFVGPFLPPLMSLPSISYLDISGNMFTGMLFKNMSCSSDLSFVNLSSNLLTGDLPTCLKSEVRDRVVHYSKNCLRNEDQDQLPSVFCHNEALAVDVSPPRQKNKKGSGKAALVFGLVGGVFGAVTIFALVSIAVIRVHGRGEEKPPAPRLITETASTVCDVRLLSNARDISQTMKMGATIPPYRTFALEELKNATNNFDNSCLIGEGSHFQVYRGKLADGTHVTIRRLKMVKKRSPQYYMPIIERISKLRHAHLLSALGHCFECYLDDSSVHRMHLIFEFTTNGTLRDHISGGLLGWTFTWTQRIIAAMEVVKGIQFLHTGIMPGVLSNNLEITDVYLNQNLHVKLGKYNIPLLGEDYGMVALKGLRGSKGSTGARVKDSEKNDVYDIGIILLELIVGRPITSQNEARLLKDLVQVSLAADEGARRSILDHTLPKNCSDESLRTMMDICIRCLSEEQTARPSVEDILWNLQFATQVQDSSWLDLQTGQESPTAPSR